LVACEFSGVVREAFRERGHDAWSVDLLPTEVPGQHIVGDAMEAAYGGSWDILIAHPPCTHLASSGARWFKDKAEQQKQALEFFLKLAKAPVPRICLENPVGVASRLGPPTQTIQPWQFGHGETKATCLWLHWLPPLKPTKVVEGREPRIHRMPPGPDRWKERSRTYKGIAQAMAEQWG